MLSPLTKEQRIKVEENMGLVGKVIQDCVHTLGAGCMFDYDDLFQIGCLGLCKAAQTDKPGHTVAFSTYAYRLIRNEIYTELERATRLGREVATDPIELPCTVLEDNTSEQREACTALLERLQQAETETAGVTAKGFQAIRMLMDGYTNREIGARFGVPANHVTAWVSRARKVLIRQRERDGTF